MSTESPEERKSDATASIEPPPRRNFLVSFLAAVIGAIVGLVPLAAGLAFFFEDPLRKKRPPSERDRNKLKAENVPDGFVFITAEASVGEVPQSFKVKMGRQDAWNYLPDQEVGSVYLRKIGEQVIAFNSRCPHLGCTVDYRPGKGDFFCPCHTSTFNLDGEKQNPIPPRDMDALDVEVVDGQVYVKFEKFRAGTPEKIPIG